MKQAYQQSAVINVIDFTWIEKGEGPLLLLLHGFPDSPSGFDDIIDPLVAQGYRVVVPYMRGYFPSGLAPNGDYSVMALARDVIAFIDHFGEQTATVVGHDWGGFAAYTAANIAPERIDRLVVMCVPHMHKTAFSLAQLKKSWYVMFFQLPWLPEKVVPRHHFRFIDRLYDVWSPNWARADGASSAVKRALSAPGALVAALGYYRAMVRQSSVELRETMARPTAVPSMVVCGEADGSVGLDQFAEVHACYQQPLTFLSLPGIGHFPQREAPDLLLEGLIPFLAKDQ